MASKPANSEQRKWMNSIIQFAQTDIHHLFGLDYEHSPFQLHHVLGRSAKHNKVPIGHYFILPVPFILHDVSSNHEFNVTHHKNAFTEEFGSQRCLFESMYFFMKGYGYSVPSDDVVSAIMNTRA